MSAEFGWKKMEPIKYLGQVVNVSIGFSNV